jgi:AcrR family transcriptional regulator
MAVKREGPPAGSGAARRRGRTRRPPREEVRRRILAAATEVFLERGFGGASVDDIAAAAGFSKGAVYSNFEDKDALFLALLDEEFAWRLDRLRAALEEAPDDPAAGAEVAGRSMMRALAAHQELHVLFSEFRVHADRSPATRRRFAQRRRQIRATLAETVAAYAERADVELTMPADHLATVLLALTNGLALERLGQADAVPDEIFGEVIATLFRPRAAPAVD